MNKTHQTKINSQLVLAVDDQPICLAILEKQLQTLGLTVDTAKDGVEAFALWKRKRHPFVITDGNMPNMDGYELATAIRDVEKVEAGNRTNIVTLSANQIDHEQRRLAAGVDKVLTKPANSEQIEALFSTQDAPTNHNTINTTLIIDFNVLEQIFPDTNKQLEILSGFQTHIENDYISLKAFAKQESLSGVESTAHRMKGSSRMVGAITIGDICEKIETEAKSGHIVGGTTLTALNNSIQALAEHLSTLTSSNMYIPEEEGSA